MDNPFRFRNRFSKSSVENYPKFAYQILRGKMNPNFTGKLYFTPKKKVDIQNLQIYVDEHLKDEWIHRLDRIKGIEVRSTCQGHDSKYVTHIIFRPLNQDLDYIKDKVNFINKNLPDTKCDYMFGHFDNTYRIGLVTRTWYREGTDNSNWERWWEKTISFLEKLFNEKE